MLFNSYTFIFAFLPLSVAGFYLVAPLGRACGALWLIAASVVFYGWWEPRFVLLLAASVAFNYAVSELIGRNAARPRLQSALLAFGIAVGLGALAYYKYLFAVLGFLARHGAPGLSIAPIVLPLGISFFTFTQIGYLIDVKQGVARDRGLLDYVLFVTFFPHLIAGPILHNREIMPQFAQARTWRFSADDFAAGLSIFIIGLLKKVVLADPTAAVVGPGFAHAQDLSLATAWNVALSYSLQLYFDFSGYSDMAIGLARMFNVRFPLNFNSPYKATSIIDYWQRWHMTLTRYITLYLYNPLALWATRRRAARGQAVGRVAHRSFAGFAQMVAFPTLVTITLAGIWHGAGLQFLVFGLLHGVYLCVNHAWRMLGPKPRRGGDRPAVHAGKIALTYGCALVAAIFFRAPGVTAALWLLAGMAGLHAHAVPVAGEVLGLGPAVRQVFWLALLFAIVWLAPNTQEIMSAAQPALGRVVPARIGWMNWRPNLSWAVAMGCGATLGILALGGTTEFIYFQF